MSTTTASLLERQAEATRADIVGAAVELLEQGGVSEVTARAVARRAGMSERTIFRHFPSRKRFLEAVAAAAAGAIGTPPPPTSLREAPAYVGRLYAQFEARAGLVRSALHTDIYSRMRETVASSRWQALDRLVDEEAPGRPEAERQSAKVNLRYYLSATTWHYFRVHFGLSPEQAVAAARYAVELVIADLTDAPPHPCEAGRAPQ